MRSWTVRWWRSTPKAGRTFTRCSRGERRLHYAAFDLLWLNGRDLRTQSLLKRQKRLSRVIPGSYFDPVSGDGG